MVQHTFLVAKTSGSSSDKIFFEDTMSSVTLPSNFGLLSKLGRETFRTVGISFFPVLKAPTLTPQNHVNLWLEKFSRKTEAEKAPQFLQRVVFPEGTAPRISIHELDVSTIFLDFPAGF